MPPIRGRTRPAPRWPGHAASPAWWSRVQRRRSPTASVFLRPRWMYLRRGRASVAPVPGSARLLGLPARRSKRTRADRCRPTSRRRRRRSRRRPGPSVNDPASVTNAMARVSTAEGCVIELLWSVAYNDYLSHFGSAPAAPPVTAHCPPIARRRPLLIRRLGDAGAARDPLDAAARQPGARQHAVGERGCSHARRRTCSAWLAIAAEISRRPDGSATTATA